MEKKVKSSEQITSELLLILDNVLGARKFTSVISIWIEC